VPPWLSHPEQVASVTLRSPKRGLTIRMIDNRTYTHMTRFEDDEMRRAIEQRMVKPRIVLPSLRPGP
jgi:hypothetical protein